MSARWWTFLVWALVAASALFWGLRLFVSPEPVPARTPVASNGPVARGDLTRLLGVDAPPPVATTAAEPPPDTRFQLIGVVAAKSPAAAREGMALIAVDGKTAKAYRVGAVVDGQTILKSVAVRGAALGPRDGPAVVNLTLAPLPAAATGTLPGIDPNGNGGNNSNGGAPMQQPIVTIVPGQMQVPNFVPRTSPQAMVAPTVPRLTPQQAAAAAQAQPNRRILPPPLPQQARDQAANERQPLVSDNLPGAAPTR